MFKSIKVEHILCVCCIPVFWCLFCVFRIHFVRLSFANSDSSSFLLSQFNKIIELSKWSVCSSQVFKFWTSKTNILTLKIEIVSVLASSWKENGRIFSYVHSVIWITEDLSNSQKSTEKSLHELLWNQMKLHSLLWLLVCPTVCFTFFFVIFYTTPMI